MINYLIGVEACYSNFMCYKYTNNQTKLSPFNIKFCLKKKKKKMKGKQSHPRLRTSWENKSYDNQIISSSEMDSLVSICEAIFPPVDLHHDDHDQSFINNSIKSFFQSSASNNPIPNEVNKYSLLN